ncbi:hypothetical protein [Polaromonas hydrogenivorans]|uniref:Uncharacterized protein n=1 Tax=Polaromonas hydrogenivorans TaxID=335476 RepID=A0AAU7LWB6_9BURK
METSKLDEIEGELFATQAAIRALLISHPERSEAVAAVHLQLEKLTALATARPIPDAFLDGIARAKKKIFPNTNDAQQTSGR